MSWNIKQKIAHAASFAQVHKERKYFEGKKFSTQYEVISRIVNFKLRISRVEVISSVDRISLFS